MDGEDNMRVRDVDGYAIVKESYWNRYGRNAFVERVCGSLEQANYERDSLERCDRISFIVIKGGLK